MSLKKILKQLALDGRYYAEMINNLAEIYYLDEAKPVVLAELDQQNLLHLNFRSDLSPTIAAQISHDLAKITPNIVVGACFAVTADKGLVYGDEALGAHYLNIFLALQSASKEPEAASNAIFIVKEPIRTFDGLSQSRTSKIHKKLWEDR